MRSAIARLRRFFGEILVDRQEVPDDLLADVGLGTPQPTRYHDAAWSSQSRLRDLSQIGPR